MRKSKLLTLGLLLCLVSNFSFASLAQDIKKIVDGIPTTHVGLVIFDVSTGRRLYSQHPNYLYSPASIQKLFTATAALVYLGSEFRYHTQLLTSGDIKGNILEGDLYIKFSGDPELNTNNLNALIKRLSDLGITHINGRVYIDNSSYDRIAYPPGWSWEDLSYGYAAPLSAVILDRNEFIMRMMPSTKPGNHPSIIVGLPPNVVHFNNHITTTNGYTKHCPITVYSDAKNGYKLNGCINSKWGRQRRTLAIRNPEMYAEATISEQLKALNIEHNGHVRVKTAPKHSQKIAEFLSPPLKIVLKELLKNSDNLVANSLLKKLGEKYYKTQGNWQNGLRAMRQIYKDKSRINLKDSLINDGSGLSRYNMLKPSQFSKLLYFAYHNPRVRPYLMDALPISGVDGTLSLRMRQRAYRGKVIAKTGSMTGVSALSGYVKNKKHGMIGFVVIMNGFVGKSWPYHRVQDKICEALVNYRG